MANNDDKPLFEAGEDQPQKRLMLPKQRLYNKLRARYDQEMAKLVLQEEKVRMLKISVSIAKKDADREAMLSNYLLR